MFAKNLSAPEDWQGLLSWSADAYVPNPLYTLLNAIGTLTETWGNAYSAGAMGFFAAGNNKFEGSPVYAYTVVTPWGSYTSPSTAGTVDGYIRIYISQYRLTVGADCTWTFAFESFTAYAGIAGGPESTILSIGAQSMSGGGYDERLNCCILQAALPGDSGFTPTCEFASAGTWSNTCTAAGGYEHGPTGDLQPDPVLLDTSTVSGTCECEQEVPAPSSGTSNSYSVSVSATAGGTILQGSGSAPCDEPGCTGSSQGYVWESGAFTNTTWETAIKSKLVPLGEQTVAASWNCTYDDTPSSGSSSSTTSPAETTCADLRTVAYAFQYTLCRTSPDIECIAPAECHYPAVYNCSYSAQAQLLWPMLPPCVPASIEPLGYDVSNALRHALTYRNAGTGHIWLSCAGNVLPQTWSDTDTGISAVWARPRFADAGADWPIGLFYGDGANCRWARTYDEGQTWDDTTEMGTAMIGDFDEGANGLRWLYKVDTPDGGTTYDVYNRLLDAQLNVLRDWTVTNVTGVDNAPIACRESPASDGSWRVGLFFSSGGVETLMFSEDGIAFS